MADVLLGLAVLLGVIGVAASVLVLRTLLDLHTQMKLGAARADYFARREDISELERTFVRTVGALESRMVTMVGEHRAGSSERSLTENPQMTAGLNSRSSPREVAAVVWAPEAAEPRLEELARRLLADCDQKPIETLSDAPAWLGEYHCSVEPIAGSSADWFLAVLASRNEGVVVPNMRRPMGRIDLTPFFDFDDYNGIEPLRPQKVVRFANVVRSGSSWSVIHKGLIHG